MTIPFDKMTELEAAAFRRLMGHLQNHDVQNIDLMNLAGFCRNCLSNWLEDAAKADGIAMTKAEARAHVYGMDYEDWKARQKPASPSQLKAFSQSQKH